MKQRNERTILKTIKKQTLQVFFFLVVQDRGLFSLMQVLCIRFFCHDVPNGIFFISTRFGNGLNFPI